LIFLKTQAIEAPVVTCEKGKTYMKKSNENIESEISKTMELLDDMLPLKVYPLFRVRLMQKIELLPLQRKGYLDLRFALVSLLVIINFSFAFFLSPRNNERQETAAAIREVTENQSDDYTNQEFAYYDQTP